MNCATKPWSSQNEFHSTQFLYEGASLSFNKITTDFSGSNLEAFTYFSFENHKTLNKGNADDKAFNSSDHISKLDVGKMIHDFSDSGVYEGSIFGMKEIFYLMVLDEVPLLDVSIGPLLYPQVIEQKRKDIKKSKNNEG